MHKNPHPTPTLKHNEKLQASLLFLVLSSNFGLIWQVCPDCLREPYYIINRILYTLGVSLCDIISLSYLSQIWGVEEVHPVPTQLVLEARCLEKDHSPLAEGLFCLASVC